MTAVEWLIERVEDADITENIWNIVKNQALEMEKNQLENQFERGYTKCADTLHHILNKGLHTTINETHKTLSYDIERKSN